MPVKILMTFLILNCTLAISAQELPATEDEFEIEYQKRIKKEYLDGVYIPKDLADCFIRLNLLTDEASRIKFKNMSEEEASTKLHFSLGRWMIHNWSFYEGSRLSFYLKNLGISHPDDMAQFIIITYHRNLNKNQLNVKDLIDRYKAKQELQQKKRIEEGEVIYEETRKRQN